MSKRFVDTGLWQKRWFRTLASAEKVAWFYLLTTCDAVGVWEVDRDAAEFSTGATIDWEGLIAASNGNIEVLSDKKWWLVDFCYFQYGVISDKSISKVQIHLYSLLMRHGLYEAYLETLEKGKPSTHGRKRVDEDVQHKIYLRDSGKCQYCMEPVPEDTSEIDHIQPVVHGGTNDEENLILCCSLCNSKKGDRSLEEFVIKWGIDKCSDRVRALIENRSDRVAPTVAPTVQEKEKEKEKEKEEEEVKVKDAAMQPKRRIFYDYPGREWRGIMQSDIQFWQDDFDGVDVVRELKQMKAWLDGHAKKKDFKRFIVGWLSRSQQRSRQVVKR